MSRMIRSENDLLDRDPAAAPPAAEDEADSTDFAVDELDEDTELEAPAAGRGEEPADAEAPAEDEVISGPDDALGLYLRQMGAIRLLTRGEEIAIAERLERARNRFRTAALYCAHIVARAAFTFEKVHAGQTPIDPTIDVYSSPEMRLSREQILARMPHDLPLVRRLLREEADAFAAGLRNEGATARRAWRRARRYRMVKLNRLMTELSPRTELLERWVDELNDMADEMSHLVRSYQDAAITDERAKRRQALLEAQEKVLLTHAELSALVRVLRKRRLAYPKVRRQ